MQLLTHATYVNVQTTTTESFFNTFDPEQGGAIGGGVTGIAATGLLWQMGRCFR